MGKGPFKMRSGNATPFKEMGSTPAKGLWETFQKGLSGRTREIGEKSEIQKLGDWEKEAKTEETAKEVQKVVDKTDNDIASTKKKDLDERKHDLKVRQQDFLEKKYADKNKPVEKPSMTAKEIKEGKEIAKARDIFKTMSSGQAEFGYQQAFDDKITEMDVKTAEKTENQEELPPAEQFVEPDSYVSASKGKSKTGSEMFGGIDNPKKVTPGGTEYTVMPEVDTSELASHYFGKKKNYKPESVEFKNKKEEIKRRYGV